MQHMGSNNEGKSDFEIHLGIQEVQCKKADKYLIRFECEYIEPKGYDVSLLKKYKKIFSWDSSGINKEDYTKTHIPNTFFIRKQLKWNERGKLCCLIAGNKAVQIETPMELYTERVKTIRWFEKNATHAFDLFGGGWNMPAAKTGFANRLLSKLKYQLPKDKNKIYFPSYRGKVESKLETMQHYRFSICYENIRDLPDYITEKIWDSFFAGCVPVYWGASNITDYIPENCFIDRRKFTNHEELYQYMIGMTEAVYTEYQERIAIFLASDEAKKFSAEAFAETIVNTIVRDLELAV